MNRVFWICILVFSSCSLKKITKVDSSDLPKNTKELTQRVNLANKSPEWLSLKGRLNVIKKEQEVSLNINIKYRKDSIIWASISAPLGIEVFRIQISQDSIYFINRTNKTYFIKPISSIREYLKTEISFSEINDLIIGSPSVIKDSYSLALENNLYIIKSENINYKIDPIKYRILQADILENDTTNITFTFSEFKEISTYFFPHYFSIRVESFENFSLIPKYFRVIFDQKQNFIFKKPSNYVEYK